jgi:nucleoid-associated protein YgaU
MPSRNTLIWVGAAAVVVVAAGAGAVVWTYPELFEPNPADIPVVANVPPESKPSIIPPPVAVTPPAASAPSKDKASPLKPLFDVVNVDPSGEAVIAGRAAPNGKVELRDGGKTVAEATADAAGQFVIIPPTLTPGDHNLTLADADKAAQPAVSDIVAVSVPAQVAKAAPVAPTNPSGPTPSPLGMRTLATPAPAVGSRVAIRSVEADAVGGLVAKGSAEPNATVRLYLNQADLAEAKTQSDGRWSLTIQSGLTPGGYVMRADEIGPSAANVVASADTPFAYPDTPNPAPPASAFASASPEPSPADPVVASVQTKRVATGHTLWALSQSYYGDPTRYPAIVEANRAQIHNPNVIFPGQVFVVPKSDAKP